MFSLYHYKKIAPRFTSSFYPKSDRLLGHPLAVIFSTQSLVLLALIAGYCGFEASVSFGYNENLITTRHRSTAGTYAYAICVFVVLASAYAELCVRSTPAAPGWQYIGVFMEV